MSIRNLGLTLCVFAFLAVAAACSPIAQPANVNSVTVEQTNDGLMAVVAGEHPDACSAIGTTVQRMDGDTLQVGIALAPTSPDMICAQTLTPYTQVVPLETQDLAPGTYDVVVNGVSTTFELGDPSAPMSAEEPKLAYVTSIELASDGDSQILTVSGDLPDGCHEVSTVTTEVSGNEITMTVEMVVPNPDLMCAQMIVPFTIDIPIPAEMEPGDYTVTANDYVTEITVQ